MLKVQDYQGKDRDDTAANDLQFRCSNTGNFAALKTNNGGPWGAWGCWSDVCSDTGICGIETRIETDKTSGDETALNDVRMYCCSSDRGNGGIKIPPVSSDPSNGGTKIPGNGNDNSTY
jgi:hypothetical protein